MPAGGELQRAVKDAGERRVQEVVPSQAAPPPDPQDQQAQEKVCTSTHPASSYAICAVYKQHLPCIIHPPGPLGRSAVHRSSRKEKHVLYVKSLCPWLPPCVQATDPNLDFPEQPIDMAQHKSGGDGPALEVRKAGESEPAGYDTTRGVNRDVGHMLLGEANMHLPCHAAVQVPSAMSGAAGSGSLSGDNVSKSCAVTFEIPPTAAIHMHYVQSVVH